LLDLPAIAVARLIRNRDVSATEVMKETLRRADEVQAHFNAFATIAHDSALLQAQKADEAIRNTPPEALPELLGVPFSVKDLLDTQGVRTTYGSRALAENVPQTDIVAVARMREAGAILIGKTTTSEFASSVLTDSPLSGITRNPWNRELTSGGSSGGAGVAAATGAGTIAVSTDGGGSSRIPGAVCGVLGLKGTLGAIPHESWPFRFGNNSSVSINSRFPEDLITAFNIMAGAHHLDPWSRRQISPIRAPADAQPAVTGQRAVFIPGLGGHVVDSEYRTIVERALEGLEGLGLRVDVAETDPTEFDPSMALHMIGCNLAARMRELPVEQQELVGPVLKGLLDKNVYKPDGVSVQAEAMERSRAYDRLEHLLKDYDLVLSPTLTAAPPLADASDDPRVVINGRPETIDKWWAHLAIANMAGHPAISIPCGTDADGLPVGLHALAGWDREQDLIDLAYAMLTVESWIDKSPIIGSEA
jgi:aspartyl-tRNA(Asn)/glutamyl-tRNA(Gln) amidotransferase subunit A